MKTKNLIPILAFSLIIFAGCDKEEPTNGDNFVGIKDISFENYPIVDCSTSARALSVMTACKLLDILYRWQPPLVDEWNVWPDYENIPEQYKDFFSKRLMFSQTHGAFMNLIDGNADIILTHRTISPDEIVHAASVGVTLVEKSIALDAFDFIVNKNNPVKSLTVNEVQKIYTGEITNWKQVGGKDTDIMVFTRPRNSGSEEVMRELVMGGLELADFPESQIGGMAQVFNEVTRNEDGFCYTFDNYKKTIVRKPDSEVPKIAINGIFPDEENVKNRTYPFIAEVHVAIRSDLDHNTMAYKLYEWLQSESAKPVISECGFIPLQ